MVDPLTPYPITPIGCFLGFMLVLPPLPLQLKASNIGVFMYGLWIAVYNLQMFVNSIIWHDNVNIVAPVWCDIVTRIQFASNPAIRGCALVICIHLYRVTRLRASAIPSTRAAKRRNLFLDLTLTLFLPLLIMALYVVVQPVRFQILEELGCQYTDFSFVVYIIDSLPSISISLISACLAPLTLRSFFIHRREMNEFLSSNGSISRNTYKRLMVIACLDTLLNLPISLTSFIESVAAGKQDTANYGYISWNHVHHNIGGLFPGISFSTIIQTPASAWVSDKFTFATVKWSQWIYVVHAIAFFLIFGTTRETLLFVRRIFWFVPNTCCCSSRKEAEKSMSDIRFDSGPVTRGSIPFVGTTNTGESRLTDISSGDPSDRRSGQLSALVDDDPERQSIHRYSAKSDNQNLAVRSEDNHYRSLSEVEKGEISDGMAKEY